MNRSGLRRFVVRRLSHGEYLGLHLTVGLLLSLCLIGVFAAIAHSMQRPRHLVPFDHELGLRLQENRLASPVTRAVVVGITQLGSVSALTGLSLLVALLLLMRRRWLLAVVWLIAPLGGGLLDLGLKLFFQRERPLFRDPFIDESTKSFPSGHSMGSLIGYGLLAYVLVLALPRPWMRIGAVCGLTVLVLSIGFSRIYLGAHYCSDVLGGYAVGGMWLAACITGLETLRRRPSHSLIERSVAAEPESLAHAD